MYPKTDDHLCSDLLATNQAAFDRLHCLSVVKLESLCHSQKEDVEEYSPGACSAGVGSDETILIVVVICSILGGGLLILIAFFGFVQFRKMMNIAQGHGKCFALEVLYICTFVL